MTKYYLKTKHPKSCAGIKSKNIGDEFIIL